MSGARFWSAILAGTLPILIAALGAAPPHVHAPLLGPLALAGLLLALGLAGSGRLASPRADVALPLAVAGGIAALSAATALSPVRSARQMVVWITGAIVLVAARHAGSGEARRAGSAIALTAALLGALGLYQSLVAFPAAAAGAAEPAPGEAPSAEDLELARLRTGRAVGTMGLPALLASILILGIPLAAARTLRGPLAVRIAWGAAAAVQAGALAATRSLGGSAALLAAAAICAARWRDVSARARAGIVTGVLLAAALAAGPRILRDGPGSALQAVEQRTANWRAGVSMVVSHPLLGTGPGGFGVAFPRHRTAASNESQHAHNGLLEIASDLGLPIVPFVLMALAGAVRWAAAAERAPARGAAADLLETRALAVGCSAWMIQNLADFGTHVASSLLIFTAAAGLLSRAARAPEAAGERRPAGPAARSALLAAALLAALVAVPDSMSAQRLDGAVESVRSGDLAAAESQARAAVLWNPFDPEPRAVLARALLDGALGLPARDPARAARVEEALAEAEEAVRLDPVTANRRAVLAAARLAAGDLAGAYAAMAAAARLNPFRASYAQERDALRAALTAEPPAPGEGKSP